jgi:hypothetical protein
MECKEQDSGVVASVRKNTQLKRCMMRSSVRDLAKTSQLETHPKFSCLSVRACCSVWLHFEWLFHICEQMGGKKNSRDHSLKALLQLAS